MAGKIDDTILSAGQNDGLERAVLQLPGLSRVVNARLRKNARWGKRWGSSLIPSANLSANPGYARGLGPGFAIVDDQCNRYDQTAGGWVNVAQIGSGDPSRIPGAVSGFVPDRAFFPMPNKSLALQKRTPCDAAFFDGYVWTVKQAFDPASSTDNMLRVVAIDPHDQSLAFLQDFPAAGAGDHTIPKLTAIGSSLALTYLAGNTLFGHVLTSLAGGFGAAISITGATLVSAYDIAPYTGAIGQALLAFCAPGTISFGTIDSSLATFLNNTGEAANNVSIVGSTSSRIFLAYGTGTTSRIRVYTPGFGLVAPPVTLSAADNARPLLALLPSGNARVVYSATEITTGVAFKIGMFRVVTISGTTALPITQVVTQYGAYPIAIPFTIGSRVYQWCQLMIQQPVAGAAGYPVLLRIDVFGASVIDGASFPLELSVQDFITATGLNSIGAGLRGTDLNGLPRAVRIGQSNSGLQTWGLLTPILYRAPLTAADIQIDFRLVQVRQFTEPAAQRGLTSFAADSASFVPMGTLTRIDDRGAVEAGFVHTPQIAPPTPGSSGGLTPSKTYYYAAIFSARNDAGRVELSGVSLPVSIAMGAGQNSNALQISTLTITARPATQIEIYRTLADTQTFYLIATVAAPLGAGGTIGFVDTLSDITIRTQPALYTQVGQQLSNGFPPASRFGCSGGGRVFVAGQVRPDVATASKLILGDQSPTFCDSDAFKIILPAPITGIAWMDSLTVFTAEGIYVVTGDGPTDDGQGEFGTPSRLPFQIGCIEPRSVITVDEGTFFQSNRGLYLLPRGFGAPVGAGDAVMSVLAEFPIITSAVAMVKPTEQTIRWTCVTADSESSQRGRTIVYDLVHKAWSVDEQGSRDGFPEGSTVCAGNWFDGEIISSDPEAPAFIRATDNGFSDVSQASETPIEMILETGDVRPFGLQARGPASRIAVLSELRAAPITLNVQRFTDRGSSPITPRLFNGPPYDPIGALNYTQIDMGSSELRSIASLRIRLSEKSATEGLALIGLSIEHGPSDGLRLDKPADRIV